jgi:hypothetical protein
MHFCGANSRSVAEQTSEEPVRQAEMLNVHYIRFRVLGSATGSLQVCAFSCSQVEREKKLPHPDLIFEHRESNPELPPTLRLVSVRIEAVYPTQCPISLHTYHWTCSCMHFCSCTHFRKKNSPKFLCALIPSLELPR